MLIGIAAFHLGFAFFTGCSLVPSFDGGAWSVVVGVVVVGLFTWAILRESCATVEIDGHSRRLTLERRYLLKTVKDSFAFEEVERFEAERFDDDGTPTAQPRLILKNGESIDLGRPETSRIAVAITSVAKAQKALDAAS